MGAFHAFCQKDHDRFEFTDPAAFDLHMAQYHKKRKTSPGANSPWLLTPKPAPFKPGEKPHPWVAPPVPKDWETRLATVLGAAGLPAPEHITDHQEQHTAA